jgi:hypothetical protein
MRFKGFRELIDASILLEKVALSFFDFLLESQD